MMSLPTTGAGHSIWGVQFYKENDGVDFGSPASVDDLFVADNTIEFWARVPNTGIATYVLTKRDPPAFTTGWDFIVQADGTPLVRVVLATNDIICTAAIDLSDDKWHHWALDFDIGTITARLFIDGVLVDTDAGVGVYQSAATEDIIVNGFNAIGSNDEVMSIGWIRLSDSRRYTGASFERPARNAYPANDANAQLLVYMNDGAGATATDSSGNGNDGTITFGANTRWYNDPVE